MGELESLKDLNIKVLDDGFIRVVDLMGSDDAIVQAARVSYGKGTKKISEDRGLIRYLMRHRHTTPFEMCEIKFHLRVPMDCWRQWIRHRSANVNEYSTRYSIAIDATQKTKPSEWRLQAASNRQGSQGFLNEEAGENLSAKEEELQSLARQIYNERLDAGIAREQARKDLPLSTYTEAYWKIDLHNLLHFLELRMDEYAQFEIRQYARAIGYDVVSKWCPFTWEAFLDYRVNSLNLSRIEMEIIQLLSCNQGDSAKELLGKYGLLNYAEDGTLKKNRERDELEQKLEKLNITKSW
ncbi:MAG TPA: FAD-dependent thymidylate synthase [Candidatus Kryptonia bacterium]